MVQIRYYSGGAVSTRDVDESVFGSRVLGRMLKEAIVMYEANRRSGTAKTKERGEVKGPNKKPWKQKHTGRARAGTAKSPLWVGGGRIFGPRPRDHGYQLPLKERRLALATALLSKFRDGEVTVVEGWPSEKPSTKAAFGVLKAAGVETSALVVTAETDKNLWLSLRNVPGLTVRPQLELNALEVLTRKNLVLTPPALDALVARFTDLGFGKKAVGEGREEEGREEAERSTEKKDGKKKVRARKAVESGGEE